MDLDGTKTKAQIDERKRAKLMIVYCYLTQVNYATRYQTSNPTPNVARSVVPLPTQNSVWIEDYHQDILCVHVYACSFISQE